MKLFAETETQFQTRLSQEEVLKRLTEYAQPQKSPPGPLQNYKVTVDGQKVVLERKVEARAFFLIKIDCKVEPQVTGTLVRAKIGLRWFGKLIMGITTLFAVPIWIATLAKLVSLSSIDTIFSKDFLNVSALFLIAYGTMMWQFNSYVKDFKEAFGQVLGAQEVEQV